MQITVIKYEETFPTAIQYKNIRLTAEATIEGDNITASYLELKQHVHDAFKAMNHGVSDISNSNEYDLTQPNPKYSFSPSHAIPEVQVDKDTDKRIAAIIEDMNKCISLEDESTPIGMLEGLYRYRMVAATNPALQEAYDKRYSELQNK